MSKKKDAKEKKSAAAEPMAYCYIAIDNLGRIVGTIADERGILGEGQRGIVAAVTSAWIKAGLAIHRIPIEEVGQKWTMHWTVPPRK